MTFVGISHIIIALFWLLSHLNKQRVTRLMGPASSVTNNKYGLSTLSTIDQCENYGKTEKHMATMHTLT